MAITFDDYLIDIGYYDITPAQEREIEAREECTRRGLDPDDDAADGVAVWMVVDQEMRWGNLPTLPVNEARALPIKNGERGGVSND